MPMFTGTIVNLDTKPINIKKGPRAGSVGHIPVLVMDTGDRFEWGFGKVPASIGDTVTFNWDVAYGNQQIDQKSFVMGKGSGISSAAASAPPKPAYVPREAKSFPLPLLHGDRVIVRQNALSHAANIYGRSRAATIAQTMPKTVHSMDEVAEDVIKMARKFEAYACGDTEREAADAIMKDEKK